jgi:8-oxo-dGTP pyrophosphatase MutT (NUDIX family)
LAELCRAASRPEMGRLCCLLRCLSAADRPAGSVGWPGPSRTSSAMVLAVLDSSSPAAACAAPRRVPISVDQADAVSTVGGRGTPGRPTPRPAPLRRAAGRYCEPVAATRQEGPDSTLVARPAATVMVVRDRPGGGAGFEVLMLRRNLRSVFVGGAYLFPGGSLEADDHDEALLDRCVGRSDAQASELLGLGQGGLAYWVAAVRECFEEAGLLLARHLAEGHAVALSEEATLARFAEHRLGLNAGRRRFLEVLEDEDLFLPLDTIHYFAHWITPRGAPRRYDTRFFVTRAPQHQVALHDAGETIADVWITPEEALRRHGDAEIEMLFPTVKNLQAISRFSSAAELLEVAAASSDQVASVQPRVVAEGNGVRLLLPGDPGYEAPPEQGPGTEAGDEAAFARAVRAAARGPRRGAGPGGTA